MYSFSSSAGLPVCSSSWMELTPVDMFERQLLSSVCIRVCSDSHVFEDSPLCSRPNVVFNVRRCGVFLQEDVYLRVGGKEQVGAGRAGEPLSLAARSAPASPGSTLRRCCDPQEENTFPSKTPQEHLKEAQRNLAFF